MQQPARGTIPFVLSFCLGLAACGSSKPVTVAPGSSSSSGGGGSSSSGGGGASDGASTYLNVLPPGSNGNSAGGVGVQGVGVVQYPPNFTDQLALYGDLSYAKQGLVTDPCTPPTDSSQHQQASNQACNYYKHEGLTPDTVASKVTLTAPDGKTVTITRDNWGVPFVDAPNRADAEYGVGYANAQDRLWLDDILRHLGRGQVTQFLGVAPGITDFDANLAAVAGYSEDELTKMVQDTEQQLGPLGPVFVSDATNFVAGVNAYIATLTGANAAQLPPEYASLKPGGFPPAAFTINDIVASAVLIQSIFAVGGGGEVTNERLLQKLDPSLNPGATAVAQDACTLWRDLRHADDPETPNTIDDHFATQSPATLDETCPHAIQAGTAIWDANSFTGFTTFTYGNVGGVPGAVPSRKPAAGQVPALRKAAIKRKSQTQRVQVAYNPIEGARNGLRKAGWSLPNTLSNWIAVNGNLANHGHPLVVMGPQTSYFVPQLLWEFAVTSHGGTALDFNGRGIDFAMLPYIEIGRGVDYAWSATSGESDLVDTRVSLMCNLDGSAPSATIVNGFPQADGYLYDAQDGNGAMCRRFFKRADTWTAVPTPASLASGGPPLPQTVNRYVLRTHYGPVFGIVKIGGQPAVVSQQRSTFNYELGTAAPFALASAGVIHDPASFQQVFNGVTGTFNWLYVDRDHIAYLHSGLYPQRAAGHDPDLPVWGNGNYEWKADADAVNGAANAAYFANNGGSVPYPARAVIQAQGDPSVTGYYEFKDYLQLAAHPKTVDPARGYMDSWNNHPAPGWWAADSNGTFGPIHRVDMLAKRVQAFKDSGQKFDFANMVEIEADAAYTDLRAQEVLPQLIQLAATPGPALTADEQTALTHMQEWLNGTSSAAWIGSTAQGLAGWRRDRDGDGVYDFRHQVVLMDAWYPRLIDALLPQVTALGENGFALQGRYDAPRAQGSAYQEGWFEFMKRVLAMALATPGHTDYRALKCAGTGDTATCRAAALHALDQAIADLGGIANYANWDGTQLANPADGKTGETVETYDEVKHTDLSLLSVQAIRWINRPTFQQVVEVQNKRP